MVSTKTPSERPVFGYIRLSTEEQLKGDGRRRQLKKIEDFAFEKGWEISEILEDIGKSAYHGKNTSAGGALFDFCKKVRSGEVENPILLVESLDRISRESVKKAVRRLLSLLEEGIKIVTLIDGQVYEDNDDEDEDFTQLIFGMLTARRAREESATKSKRHKENWRQKRALAKTGLPMTKMCPEWLEVVGKDEEKEFRIREDRVKIVEEIFSRKINGDGDTTIANDLNERGVETWGKGERKGKKWYPSYIKKIRQNKAVYGHFEPTVFGESGKRVPSGKALPNYYPRVVSKFIFNEVQKVIARKAVRRDANPDSPKAIGLRVVYNNNLVAGFFSKGLDKRKKNPEYLAYYVAKNSLGKTVWSMRHLALEALVYEALVSYEKPSEKLGIFRQDKSEVKILAQQIQLLEMKISSLIAAIEEGVDTTEMRQKIKKYSEEKEEKELELEGFLAGVKKEKYHRTNRARFLAKLKKTPLSKRSEAGFLMQQIVSQVDVHPENIYVNFLAGGFVKIPQ